MKSPSLLQKSPPFGVCSLLTDEKWQKIATSYRGRGVKSKVLIFFQGQHHAQQGSTHYVIS